MSGIASTGQGKLGKYELRGVLGRGAMGTVYDGWDPAIDRRVAIKTVRVGDADDEEIAEALARFKREAQAAGRLSHANIVGVYDYGETDQIAFIVMEFVEGRSLKNLIDQEKRLPPAEAAEIMTQVLAGLAYSHARGVIHRDVKPANMMLTTEGQVKIADFGIARIESSSMTSAGTVMGTPAYMPPEQFLGEPVDARSDIYAAGVMLYHMLTGERPYEGTMASITTKKLSAAAPPMPSARGVSPAFDPVIGRAMARQPAERYPSAGAFSAAIAAALTAAPHVAERPEDCEDDATIVAPRAGATPQPPRAMAPPPAMPGPGPAPGPAKVKAGGPPMALIGGAVVVLLGGGAAAYFALRPAPAPGPGGHAPAILEALSGATGRPGSALPAAPAQKATDPDAAMSAVRAAIAGLPCSVLETSWLGRGAGLADIAVNGLVGAGAADQAARAAVLKAAAGVNVNWTADAVPTGDCAALDAVRLAETTQGSSQGGSFDLTMDGDHGKTVLEDGDPIAPRLVMPGFAAWPTVVYLPNDGSGEVALYPELNQPPRQQKPNAIFTLTTIGKSGVGPPYGRDLVIAIATARPLFDQPRPKDETAAAYLDALVAAVKSAKAQGQATAAAVIVVDTKAKAQ